MEKPGGVLVGGMKPVAYLLLGYCLENTEQAGEPSIWVNMNDILVTLKKFVVKKSLPVNITAGHVKAAFLMLEGGYISIERGPQETGRNLEHAFKVRINPSGKALFEQLTEEVGYPLKNIMGTA